MVVRNEQQALCVAVEMEKRAIRVYERALMLVTDPAVEAGIREILADEKTHLQRFSDMKCACNVDPREDQLLIQAMGADVLFPGGVMELAQAKGLSTLKGLYQFAAESESDAMVKYADFAMKCEKEAVRDAFMSIAQEEAKHFAHLRDRLAEIEAQG